MPFDPCTYEEAREWAAKREEQMPRCDRCGELLPENHFTVPDLDGDRFCREFCAEKAYAQACTELVVED
jgi:formylmethanofuran dehydrogenase subunit E